LRNNLLYIVSEDRKNLENTIEKMKNAVKAKKEQYNKKHRQNHDLHIYYKRMMSDLNNTILYIQEPAMFKKAVQNLYKLYCKSSNADNNFNAITPEVANENKNHISVLKKKISDLKKESLETQKRIEDEYVPILEANNDIISEIDKLREENGLSNKYTAKKSTMLQKCIKEREMNKQKSAIKAIATFKAVVKNDEIDENKDIEINKINCNQQLIKTT